jgi:heme oxygenase
LNDGPIDIKSGQRGLFEIKGEALIALEPVGGDKGKYMILKRLKLATSASHTALESQLPLMKSDLSLDDYHQFVSRFFGFYAPLESQLLAASHWQILAFDYQARQKTPRLKQDVLALGSSPESLAVTPKCTDLPEVTTREHLLGCLYVIEGATLGGSFSKCLNLAPHCVELAHVGRSKR